MPKPLSHIPTIALIGRTNVGKSSLFNRLTEEHRAIVAPNAGTTRDRTYGECLWRGRKFQLIDTGGADVATVRDSIGLLFEHRPDSRADPLGGAILRQTQTAIREADLIMFVVDAQSGLLPADRQLAKLLQRITGKEAGARWGKPKRVLVVCNKIDRPADNGKLAEFFGLGLGVPMAISAKNGLGSGELLDELAALLPDATSNATTTADSAVIRVGLVGKPNVGKSSLLNCIAGTERVVTSPIPLTTRETQEIRLVHRGHTIVLYDTAGIKPWKKTARGVEHIATSQSLETLKHLDVALLVIEGQNPISHQDQALSAMMAQGKSGVAILFNKWDLVAAAGSPPPQNLAAHVHRQLPPLAFAPVLAISARSWHNVAKILDLVVELWERRQRRIDAAQLQSFPAWAARRALPSGTGKGRAGQPGAERPRLIDLEQSDINPPSFTLWIGPRQSLSPTYRRFLERIFIQRYQLEGTNCKLYVKQRRPAHRRPG